MELSVILLINLLGASESKAQMVVSHGTVSAMFLVTSSVTGGSLALPGFAPLLWSLQSQACSSLVVGSDLFL